MGFDAHLKQNGHFISMFLEVRNLMSASALFYTFLLFHVTDSTSEKTLNYADSSNVYAPSWAIQLHSSANDDDANYIATILGLKYEKVLRAANVFKILYSLVYAEHCMLFITNYRIYTPLPMDTPLFTSLQFVTYLFEKPT